MTARVRIIGNTLHDVWQHGILVTAMTNFVVRDNTLWAPPAEPEESE